MIKLGKHHPLVASVSNSGRCGGCINKNLTYNCKTCPNTYGFNMCNQPYALCSSAKCTLVSGTSGSTDAIYKCYCDVELGCSTGTQPCSSLKPFTLNGKIYIYSTYNPNN